jgi:putative membrane protein
MLFIKNFLTTIIHDDIIRLHFNRKNKKMNFLTIKAIHIISVICWMAALLYLPRLFVYHSSNTENDEINKLFCLMEKRLINFIMTPAMVFSIISGTAMLHMDESYLHFWWMHVKLICIVLLILMHRYFMALHDAFVEGRNQKDHIFFRKINEMPTVLMIVIVFLIVLKP